MRRFSAEYLAATRAGMWSTREALADLSLGDRDLTVDVGCGTGEFAGVLAEETPGRVFGVDRDPRLLAELPDAVEGVLADARRLPLRSGGVDLAACQALLINLPDPAAAVEELTRASRELVAAVEPDNGAVEVDSSVATEADLSRRARRAFIAGVETDVTLGADVRELFEAAGLEVLSVRRHDHERVVEPPYDETDVEAVRRRASGAAIEERRAELLAGGLTEAGYGTLLAEWRRAGRTAAEQMQAGEYRRREVIPFYVTVGRVPEGG